MWGVNYAMFCPMHAAAPELLKALQAIVRAFNGMRAVTAAELKAARAAIAEAEGR